MGKKWISLFAGCMVIMALTVAATPAGERRYVEDSQDNRPAIWKEAAPRAALMGEKMARLDAMRKLAELIYGMRIDGQTTVYDLSQANSDVRAALQHNLAGMREQGYIYYPDGSCQLKMAVTWRTVVENVSATITEKTRGQRVIDRDIFVKRNLEYHDSEIVVWGSGAIEGSPGVAVIQAQRAAEMDAFEKMAQRLCGVQINSNTSVRDMALESDRIQSTISNVINGVQFTDYRHLPNGVVEAEAKVTKALFIQRLQYAYNEERKRGLFGKQTVTRDEFLKATTTPAGEAVFVEVGKGLPPESDEATTMTTTSTNSTGAILPPASSGLPSGYYYLNSRRVVKQTLTAGLAVK